MFTGLNTPEDYLRVIKNHWLLIVVPILVSLGLAWGLYEWLPKSYRASTLLNFEVQKVRYVKSVEDTGQQDSERPDVLMTSRMTLMKEVLYKREVLTKVAEEFHLYGYDKANTTAEKDDGVAGRMRELVKFDTRDAPFLRVSFADPEPTVARDVVTRLADLFVQEYTQNREVIATSSSEFLQHQIDLLKAQLETRERALTQFKQAHLGELPEQMGSNLNALDRLEAETRTNQEMEKALILRLESVDKAIREYEDPTSDVGLKRAEKDPRLGKIKELQRTLAGLQSLYKETYPDVARVRDEIRRLQAMTTEDYIALYVEQEPPQVDGGTRKRKIVDPYKAELLKQREDIQREFELLRHRQARAAEEIKKYESRLEHTTVHQETLMAMQRDYENLQRNFQGLLEKKLAIGIAGDLEKKRQGTQMRIIEPAKLPVWPEKPNVLMIMFGGLAIGCALGFGSAFGLEIMRRGFVTADEIETTLGLPVLATISQFESAWPNAGKASSGQPSRQGGLLSLASLNQNDLLSSNGTHVSVGPEVVAMWHPRSVVAEQYRVAATRLALMVHKQKSIVVVVASAIMGEGKTSTALNMAHVLSRDLNRKTVLVNCDLKRPMVHAYAGMESTAGVSEVLLGHKTVEECLQYHEQLRFWILFEGSEQSGTAALAYVDRLSELIENLRSRFDYVVIDSPPLLPVAEAMVIVRMADVVAHVVRARSTPRDVVANAIKMIGQDRAVAVVLNGVEAKDAPYSYYSYGHRAYEPHPKRIG